MARKALLGNKLRRLRREQKLSQVELARQIGISASYLNLIEHNQRPLTLPLLLKLADRFDIDLQTFSQDGEARLFSELSELFGDPLFDGAAPNREEINEVIDLAPTLGPAVVALYRAYRAAREDLQALSERLSDEFFLSTSTHELRTLLTTIRTSSEILRDHQDMAPEDRRRFVAMMAQESERLSAVVDQMLSFAADQDPAQGERAAPPEDEVDDLLQAQGNHFPTLEEAADRLRDEAGLVESDLPDQSIARLAALVGLEVVTVLQPKGALGQKPAPLDGRLELDPAESASGQRFHIARAVATMAAADEIDALLAQQNFGSAAAETLYRDLLIGYLAGALILPYDAFLAAARRERYDITRLMALFAASFEQVCHRLTTLQRLNAKGVPFHFLRVDIAGNLSKRFSASGLRIARFGGVCPRWAVHSAFLAPGQIRRQISRMPDGSRYLDVACTVAKGPERFGEPQGQVSISLGCDIGRARELVYSDGLDLEAEDTIVPIGVTCRLCERDDCGQRAAAPILPSLQS